MTKIEELEARLEIIEVLLMEQLSQSLPGGRTKFNRLYKALLKALDPDETDAVRSTAAKRFTDFAAEVPRIVRDVMDEIAHEQRRR